MPTAADIAGRKMVSAAHVDGSRGYHAWIGIVDGVPRLSRATGLEAGKPFTRWYVDNKAVLDLQMALAVINGVMTLETALERTMAEEKKPKQKHSITAQLEEVEYELEQREKVYPRIAAKEPRRSAELDLHVDRMKAVWTTLDWLREKVDFIKWALRNEAAVLQRCEDLA